MYRIVKEKGRYGVFYAGYRVCYDLDAAEAIRFVRHAQEVEARAQPRNYDLAAFSGGA